LSAPKVKTLRDFNLKVGLLMKQSVPPRLAPYLLSESAPPLYYLLGVNTTTYFINQKTYTMVSSTLRNALALGACCASGGAAAFAPPPPAAIKSIPSSSSSSLRYNLRNPDGGPGRGGRPAYDPFSPSPRSMRQNDAPPLRRVPGVRSRSPPPSTSAGRSSWTASRTSRTTDASTPRAELIGAIYLVETSMLGGLF
jgi:hypothetical protein